MCAGALLCCVSLSVECWLYAQIEAVGHCEVCLSLQLSSVQLLLCSMRSCGQYAWRSLYRFVAAAVAAGQFKGHSLHVVTAVYGDSCGDGFQLLLAGEGGAASSPVMFSFCKIVAVIQSHTSFVGLLI